jgi:urease accessory protein UreH
LDDDAELHCQWDPVIPFADARLDQRFDLCLAESSRLYWSDALMSGRVSRGETWQFKSLAHELRVRVGASLAYLERYCLTPCERAIDSTWIAAGADYLGTALVHHPRATAERVESLHRRLTESSGVRAAVDLVATRLAVARFMGEEGASFARARASYRTLAVQSIFGGQELVMRK